MAGSGMWRERFIVQAASSATDALGQASPAWTEVCQVRGSVRPTQREVIDDLGNAVRTDLELETAYHADINARCRLYAVSTGKTYYASSVTDPSGFRKRILRILCTEQTP